MGGLSDEELVNGYRTLGDPQRDEFLNQLFERHRTRVAAWCYRMTGDVDAATDLAQDVFLKAFQNLESFRGQLKFTTWLYSIARNRCMDALKSRAATPFMAGEAALERVEDLQVCEPLSAMERRQAEEVVDVLVAVDVPHMGALTA